MWMCLYCKEELEDTFDSCWKCGTERDGSPPENPEVFRTQYIQASTHTRCLSCGSEHILTGGVAGYGLQPPKFTPNGTKFFALSFSSPEIAVNLDSCICLDCGLLWSSIDIEEAYKIIQKWGSKELKEQITAWMGDKRQLLRPASGVPDTSPEQLLRPTPHPPSDQRTDEPS